jgi:predicted ATP-grasp superfamily ATP-dependent carboligase
LENRIAYKKPIVLDLCITGLGVIRNFGERGIRSIGIDSDIRQVGRFSRYCDFYKSPVLEESDEEFLSFLLSIGKGLESPGILFPVSDKHVEFVAKHQEALKESFLFKVAPIELINKILNKQEMYRMAEDCGMIFPRTYFPKNEEDVRNIAQNIGFPCAIKPIYSHLLANKINCKLIPVANKAELISEYQKILSIDSKVMIQEIIPGADNQIFVYSAYCSDKGIPQGIFTGRKLRQFPTHYGTACLAESLWVPEVAELSTHFLHAIAYQGIGGIEFKKDPRDGKFKLMEINARLVQWHGITKVAGTDLCFAQYLDLTGHPAPLSQLIDNIKWIYLKSDLISSFKYMREGSLSITGWISSLKNIQYVADMVFTDPLPFIVSLLELSRIALRKIILRISVAGIKGSLRKFICSRR